jgi:hypothetical protein
VRRATAVLTCVAIALLSAAPASGEPTGRAVQLSAARHGADFSATLRPGASVTVENQCGHGGFFTEYSAYRSNGGALGAQQWREGRTLVTWAGRHGRVTFDGITFKNGTLAVTIVAGWCS